MSILESIYRLEETQMDYQITRLHGYTDGVLWIVALNGRNTGNGATLAAAADQALMFYAHDLLQHPDWVDDQRRQWLLNYQTRMTGI